MIRIGLRNEGAEDKLTARFPYSTGMLGTWFVSAPGTRELIAIRPGADLSFFKDCILVNDFQGAVRIKYIKMLILVAKQQRGFSTPATVNDSLDLRFMAPP